MVFTSAFVFQQQRATLLFCVVICKYKYTHYMYTYMLHVLYILVCLCGQFVTNLCGQFAYIFQKYLSHLDGHVFFEEALIHDDIVGI